MKRALAVFKGWLGDRNSYAFADNRWGSLVWQLNEEAPVGINPAGFKNDKTGVSHDIGGVLADDARRADPGSMGTAGFGYTWPWSDGTGNDRGYVYEALQGVMLQAIIARRVTRVAWGVASYDPFAEQHEAIRRALAWLNDILLGNFLANDADTGTDDGWIPHIGNAVYGTAHTATIATVGKAFAYADWFINDANWP